MNNNIKYNVSIKNINIETWIYYIDDTSVSLTFNQLLEKGRICVAFYKKEANNRSCQHPNHHEEDGSEDSAKRHCFRCCSPLPLELRIRLQDRKILLSADEARNPFPT